VKRTLKVLVLFTVLAALSPAAVRAGTWHARPTLNPARVLVLGDSVFNAFMHVESARDLMNERQTTIFATQGCQRLLYEGCMDFAKLSALQQLRRHAGKFTDVVVVGTGYNDRLGPEFKQAVTAIVKEAESQGVEVLWVSYRQSGNVRGKSRVMNEQLRRFDTKIDNLHVADWNMFSKDANSWFRSDRLHLVAPGADALALLLNSSLEPILAARPATAVAG
jgi:lysophospholipase L1-like esterase